MHATCSNDIPPIMPNAECHPLPASTRDDISAYLDNLLANITPDLLESDGRLRLIVGSLSLAETVRGLLAERGRHDVDVVAAVPAQSLTLGPRRKQWTPQLQQAKQAAPVAKSLLAPRPQVTQKVNTKARKAARKRAKAGRKAAR